MSKTYEYSEAYGHLAYLSREEYFRGDWEYVDSEELPSGELIDIVRSLDNADWRYTVI